MTRLPFILFCILATLMALDSMVTTPLALRFIPNAYEGNPFGATGYREFGLPYFFLAGVIEIAILALVIEGLDAIGYRLNQNNVIRRGENGRYRVSYRYGPVLAATLPGICIIGWTVVHNAEIVLEWLF